MPCLLEKEGMTLPRDGRLYFTRPIVFLTGTTRDGERLAREAVTSAAFIVLNFS